MKKGAFITIYGINNIGKSTHSILLVQRLKKNGYDAVHIKYPIYDLEPTGPQINAILRSDSPQTITEEALQALFMQNRRDFESQLKKMLAEGKIVIAEDYTGTGIAWGAAKGADQHWLIRLNENLLQEDLALLLTGMRNIRVREKKHIHETNDELVERVGKILRELSTKYNWHVIELERNIHDTAEKIWAVVKNFLDR